MLRIATCCLAAAVCWSVVDSTPVQAQGMYVCMQQVKKVRECRQFCTSMAARCLNTCGNSGAIQGVPPLPGVVSCKSSCQGTRQKCLSGCGGVSDLCRTYM